MDILGLFMIAGIFVAVSIVLDLYRAFSGPTVFDRLMAISVIGTKTAVIIPLIGFLFERPGLFIDISLSYALLNFVGTLIVAKYLERGELWSPYT